MTCGLLHPDRKRVSDMFRQCFPDCTYSEVDAFVSQLTTRSGHGLASKIQIEAFLYDSDAEGDNEVQGAEDEENTSHVESKTSGSEPRRAKRYASASEAIAACKTALVKRPRKPRPVPATPPRPSTWIHKALTHEDKSLARYSRKFIDARLASREAVLAEPALEVKDLETLGVNKLGDQRRIMQLLQRLRNGEDDGVLKKGDTLGSAFGNGCVRSHRLKDDVYEISLGWGTLYALEENAGIKRKVTPVVSCILTGGGHDTNRADLAQLKAMAGDGSAFTSSSLKQLMAAGMPAQEYKELH